MLFFAMAAAGMLASCSSEDNVEGNNPNESSLQKIELGVSTVANATTRGTGTVGGVLDKEEKNEWAGQDLWVYMLERGKMNIAKYVDPDKNETKVFDNQKFLAPTSTISGKEETGTGVATTFDKSVKYYPVDGQYDFWGYHIDDAYDGAENGEDPKVIMYDANGSVVADENNADQATKRVVDVTIKGDQDIMVGKASLDAGDVEKLGNQPDNYYSAYAARKGVQPNITFEHLLTRFTFKVKAGSESATGNGDNTEPVYVTGISVKSKNKGHLTVAYTGERPESLLTFDETEPVEFELKERTSDDQNAKLDKLTETPLTWNSEDGTANTLPIGEALLVAPNETSYELTINLSQNVLQTEGGAMQPMKLRQISTLKLDKEMTQKFLAGHSYEVTITVYGLEKIEVSASLEPWKDGGNIDIDDDVKED